MNTPTPVLRRILYVEDDDDIREVAWMALADVSGFEVLACPSGAEALAQVDEFRPDLVLLDVMMPEMDGPTTLRALRARGLTQPVVFMTAKVQPSEVAEFMKLGVADVVAKPFDPMTLGESLRTIWARVARNGKGAS